ncbi:MAG: sugar ABC transporter substrate-binding protein [Lautropia sp.]|nr:sugar ABC transporter substrate-binding protein [Lautropia sp.]
MKPHFCTGVALSLSLAATNATAATDLVVATVNNGHMIEMQKLTPFFEKEHPDIHLKWVILEEGTLRQRVATDVATKSGQFDVVTIGMYETPFWSKRQWLTPINTDADYDVNDLLKPIRDGLSYQGKLYAAPFYGESSLLMYRKDLTDKAGVHLPEHPTWNQVREAAEKIHDPQHGVYGICLRGKPGWGDNMAFLSTMVNTFGGQWFNMDWKPQIDTQPWKEAITFYVDMMKRFGPPGATANSFNENLALFNEGKCGVWVDASIAASFVSDPKQSKVADHVAFTQAPTAKTSKGANWLWAWSLGIPSSSKHQQQAQTFVKWATSKSYIQLVAKEAGWRSVPTGTRKSTYESPEFIQISRFAKPELTAIESATPNDSTLEKSPYVGIQFAAIPEFQVIGVTVGQQISAALAGTIPVEQALATSQRLADREMKKAGYYRKH